MQSNQNFKRVKDFYHFDINSTTNCNLRCTYCIEHDWFKKPASTPDASLVQNIKDKAEAMLSSEKFLSKFGGLGFFFWGGEPTLNPDLVIDLVEHFKDEPRVAFFIYSNGFSLGKLRDFLFEHRNAMAANGMPKIVLQVSYDGKASHDIARLDVSGKGSAEKVMSTIKQLQDMAIPHTIKSTIAYEDLNTVAANYYEFREMALASPMSGINYNPTIDYLSDHNFTDEELQKHLDEMKEQIKIIARDEILYYKKHGKFFFEWLNPNKAICGAGAGLGIIDLNGDVLVCHGALYEDNRNEHVIGNINNSTEAFIDEILLASEKYSSVRNILPDECATCFAHYCMKCNVKKTSNSEKEEYFDRWVDYDNQNHICKLYKYMGTIRMSLLKIIKGD